MAKFYGYARKSTDGQSQASFDVQLKYLDKCADDVDTEFVGFSETGSGKDVTGRPILQKILAELQPGDIIGVYDGSRLGRNTQQNLIVAEQIHAAGAKLQINGKFVDITNPSDELAFGVESIVSTFQRKNQLRKSLSGIEAKKANGEWIFTSRLMGWSVTFQHGIPVVTINEQEAKIIHDIFDKYEAGESTRQISQWLTAHGYSSREGSEITAAQVRRTILRPIYSGLYMVDGPGAKTDYASLKLNPRNMVKSKYYPPIITEEQFWRVYDSHRKVDRRHTRQFVYRWRDYPLTSVINCSCGKRYVHSWSKIGQKVNGNYVSTNHYSGCNTRPTTLRAKYYEPLFEHLVYLSFLWSGDILGQILKEKDELAIRHQNIKGDLKRIEERAAGVDGKINNLVSAVEAGMPFENVKDRVATLKQQKEMLEESRKKLVYTTMTDEEQLESLADQITDEKLVEFSTMDVGHRRQYYLQNLTATVSNYMLTIEFPWDMKYEIGLHKNRGRYVQTVFPIQVYREGRRNINLSFNAVDEKLVAYEKITEMRIKTIYDEVIQHKVCKQINAGV